MKRQVVFVSRSIQHTIATSRPYAVIHDRYAKPSSGFSVNHLFNSSTPGAHTFRQSARVWPGWTDFTHKAKNANGSLEDNDAMRCETPLAPHVSHLRDKSWVIHFLNAEFISQRSVEQVLSISTRLFVRFYCL